MRNRTLWSILVALSVSHLLNDTIQSLLPALYPLLKTTHGLNFSQIGLITFVFQLTASLLQPVVGTYTDRRPKPYSLPIGMSVTLVGLVLLSQASTYALLLLSSALIGTGSSIFHPESSRLARLASGGRHGFAQSLFQVGGNLGSSLGPLAAAWIVLPRGQGYVLWFTLLALAAVAVLFNVGRWYAGHLAAPARAAAAGPGAAPVRDRGTVVAAIAILLLLILSKYFYLASMTSYYTFFLIGKFGLSVREAEFHLFIFLFAIAAGTIVGGPVGDRFGRKLVIWISILGVAPFSLTLPHAGLVGTTVLAVCAGFILASAMSAILVYAQELLPGNIGMVTGLFFGFAFGMAGIGSAALGKVADRTSIDYVFRLSAWFPLAGLLTAFLPDLRAPRAAAQAAGK